MRPPIACLFLVSGLLNAQEPGAVNPLLAGRDQTEAFRVSDSIYAAFGFGNTFLLRTPEGNLVIDTSMRPVAVRHKKLLQAVDAGPVKYIILTHGHGDHRGGVEVWRQAGTTVIAQNHYVEMLHYQARLAGFFAARNAAQFGALIAGASAGPAASGNYSAKIDADLLFDKRHDFSHGGVRFEIHHTPGETPDALSVWAPQWKAAFVGDNYYESFPNIYTLRGTKARWALDYVESLNKVLVWEPEILLPSHGRPLTGKAAIRQAIERYRDAILHVHDATVRGMNEGKDVFTLMREIRLPQKLAVGEGYGNLPWSVRGIYEGYAGWFDGNPSSMFAVPASSILPELVGMAGGPAAAVARAHKAIEEGRHVEALHWADAALAADGAHRLALQAKIAALEALSGKSVNSNERGWLDFGIRESRRRLSAPPP